MSFAEVGFLPAGRLSINAAITNRSGAEIQPVDRPGDSNEPETNVGDIARGNDARNSGQ